MRKWGATQRCSCLWFNISVPMTLHHCGSLLLPGGHDLACVADVAGDVEHFFDRRDSFAVFAESVLAERYHSLAVGVFLNHPVVLAADDQIANLVVQDRQFV